MPEKSRSYKKSTAIKRYKKPAKVNYEKLPFLDRATVKKVSRAGKGDTFTVAKKRRFLELFCILGTKGECASAVGVTQQTVSYHLDNDPVFDQQFKEAHAYYREAIIEGEIRRRAIEGVDEPVFATYMGEGKQVGTKKVYSDKMLEMLAKANAPKFRDAAGAGVNVSTSGVLVVNAPAASGEEWAAKFEESS